MKTRYLILIILFLLIVCYFIIGSIVIGHNLLFFMPSIIKQLIENEGNGIICVDRCGPCSAWGYQYITINGECVLPSEESCKLYRTPGDWRFVEWTCQPACKEPYSDICKNEMIMQKIQELTIKDCQPRSESSLLSPNILYANVTHHFDGNTCKWYGSD